MTMPRSNLIRLLRSGLASLIGLLACADEGQSPRALTEPGQPVPAQVWRVEDAAAALRDQAVGGVRRRGEQDRMLGLETQLPGFGGFYIDSLDEVVVYVKPDANRADAAASAARVRAVLAAYYGARPEMPVRAIMAPVARAEIREAQYGLSELIAMENRIASGLTRIPGFVGIGTSLFLNRVKVGFRTEADIADGLRAIESLGISREAIVAEAWGQLTLSGTWNDLYRPTRGGLATGVSSQMYPSFRSRGSHGYNVLTSSGTSYAMLAAHQPNLFGVNGATGDTLFQPWNSPTAAFARVSVNPPWAQGAACGVNPETGANYDYCTTADVALASFISGNTGERKIGTSQYEGNNGSPGSQEINNWYPVSGVVDPEFIQVNRNVVHKSGQQTGTTTGFIDLPCTTIGVRITWALGTVWLKQDCVTRVSFAGWGTGDSGAPVFARKVTGGPYWALGIQTTGQGTLSSAGGVH